MTMLSGHTPHPRPFANQTGEGPFWTRGTFGLQFELAGEPVEALADGALWAPRARALIVSDLHLEKGAAYARRGQMLPPYDTRATLQRLAQSMEKMAPETVVSLGDSFHEADSADRLDPSDREHLKALARMCKWVWILGNHDPAIPDDLDGLRAETIQIGPLILRHEPQTEGGAGEVAGHLHPCAKIAGRGRAIRARCFISDGARLVMPSCGAFTGGLNVCDVAFARLFTRGFHVALLAQGGLHPAPRARLIADR
jgi:DNA ligase-associated metallophosphoesterase